jgi:hypothetical protein
VVVASGEDHRKREGKNPTPRRGNGIKVRAYSLSYSRRGFSPATKTPTMDRNRFNGFRHTRQWIDFTELRNKPLKTVGV